MKILDIDATRKTIKKKIKESKYSIHDIAKMMGLTVVSIYKWQNGSSLPTLDNLVILSGILNCETTELIKTKEIAYEKEA